MLCTDPYVQDPELRPMDEVVNESEILIIGAPHHAYRTLQLNGREIVDIWDCLGRGIHL